MIFTPVLKWWLFLWCQIIFVGISWKFNFFQAMNTGDATKITWGILVMHFVITMIVGIMTFNWTKHQRTYDLAPFWFIAETMLGLGMLGTIIGLLIMLSTLFGTNPSVDTAALQVALQNMTLGMATALYTTLIGLVCSILLKAQLVNLEYAYQDKATPQLLT